MVWKILPRSYDVFEHACTHAWHGMAWHGMAWHGMAWHGMFELGVRACSNHIIIIITPKVPAIPPTTR